MIIHLDLNRVDLNERVQVQVEVVLKGTPEGVHQGGHLDQMSTEVEIECLVTSIPEDIRANIIGLKVGEMLTAGDLELPEGVTLVTEPDTAIATVRVKGAEVEEEEVAEEAESAEPEVITREKREEEE